jgi:hypothetical protein
LIVVFVISTFICLRYRRRFFRIIKVFLVKRSNSVRSIFRILRVVYFLGWQRAQSDGHSLRLLLRNAESLLRLLIVPRGRLSTQRAATCVVLIVFVVLRGLDFGLIGVVAVLGSAVLRNLNCRGLAVLIKIRAVGIPAGNDGRGREIKIQAEAGGLSVISGRRHMLAVPSMGYPNVIGFG